MAFHLASIISPLNLHPAGDGVLSQLVLDGLSASHPALSKALAIALVFFQSILLILLSITHRLREDITLYAGVFYCIFAAALPVFIPLNAAMMANLFLILAMGNMMNAYKKSDAIGELFNTGIYIGLASLFYFSTIAFVGWAIICLSILRSANLRENLAILIGAAVPYLLTVTANFWFGQLDVFLRDQFELPFGWLEIGRPDTKAWIKLGAYGLLVLIALLSSNQYMSKKNIEVQKKLRTVYWMMLFAGLSVLLQREVDLTHLLFLCPALGLFLALNFSTMQTRWAESIHFLLLLLILALHFSRWLVGVQW